MPEPRKETPLTSESLAKVLLKSIALLLMLLGAWGVSVNILEALPGFDPNFLGYFFWAEVFRPFALGGLGVLLWLMAGKVARVLSK